MYMHYVNMLSVTAGYGRFFDLIGLNILYKQIKLKIKSQPLEKVIFEGRAEALFNGK